GGAAEDRLAALVASVALVAALVVARARLAPDAAVAAHGLARVEAQLAALVDGVAGALANGIHLARRVRALRGEVAAELDRRDGRRTLRHDLEGEGVGRDVVDLVRDLGERGLDVLDGVVVPPIRRLDRLGRDAPEVDRQAGDLAVRRLCLDADHRVLPARVDQRRIGRVGAARRTVVDPRVRRNDQEVGRERVDGVGRRAVAEPDALHLVVADLHLDAGRDVRRLQLDVLLHAAAVAGVDDLRGARREVAELAAQALEVAALDARTEADEHPRPRAAVLAVEAGGEDPLLVAGVLRGDVGRRGPEQPVDGDRFGCGGRARRRDLGHRRKRVGWRVGRQLEALAQRDQKRPAGSPGEPPALHEAQALTEVLVALEPAHQAPRVVHALEGRDDTVGEARHVDAHVEAGLRLAVERGAGRAPDAG